MSALHALRPNPRHLVWLPAAMLLAWGVLAAAGVSLVPSSKAVTSTQSSLVEATVIPHISLAGTCLGTTFSGVTMNSTSPATPLISGGGGLCSVEFYSTNGTSGAQLYAENLRTNASQRTFCKAAPPGNCVAADSFTDVPDGSAGLADGEFGIRVDSVTGCSAPTWNAAALTDHYSVAVDTGGNGELVCSDAAGPAGNRAIYSLSYEADPSGATTSGAYNAEIRFTAEAN